MTRGRPPRQTIQEAMAIAKCLGKVVEGSPMKKAPADLTIFCKTVTIYVNIRRSRSRICGIFEIADKYMNDLLRLRAIPLTPVVLHELWVRLPNGRWQYFRIAKDGILEIHNSGDFDRTPADCDPSAIPPDPSPIFNRDSNPVASPMQDFVCPYFEYMKGKLSP
jgi:hypothetical protein